MEKGLVEDAIPDLRARNHGIYCRLSSRVGFHQPKVRLSLIF